MLDLTLNQKDKKDYVTKVYLQQGSKNYFVKYADDHIEEKPFSISALNQDMQRMETQLVKYEKDFTKRIKDEWLKSQISKLTEVVMALAGIYFVVNIDIPNSMSLILAGCIAALTLLYQLYEKDKGEICRIALEQVDIMDTFLENKDKFLMDITDPKTGKKEKWYLLSLSSIEEISSISMLNSISKALTPEVIEEEREKTEECLKTL